MDSTTAALILPTVIGLIAQTGAAMAVLCLEYVAAAIHLSAD